MWGADAVIRDNQILSNSIDDWYGSAIAVYYSTAVIDRNRMSGNMDDIEKQAGVVGIGGTSAQVSLTNNLIAGNTGRGILVSEGAIVPKIMNNTITQHPDEGISAWEEGTSIALVRNNIISNNGGCGLAGAEGAAFQTVDHNDVWQNGGDGEANYCDYGSSSSAPPAPGAGSLSMDPLYADASHGDFHLRAASPGVDSGAILGAPHIDLDGQKRPSASTDMGAYEFQWPQWHHVPIVFKGW